jgi:parvulin-like peptidyl-prolyl isomerase
MMLTLRWSLLLVGALVAGVVAGEFLFRSVSFRDLAGRVSGRGRLVAITNGQGIYQADLGEQTGFRAADLIFSVNAERASKSEPVAARQVDRELGLVSAQFGGDSAFRQALQSDRADEAWLRERVRKQLRALAWLEKQIVPATVTDADCRAFYETNPRLTLQPERYRAAHIFLAAHRGTPSEVVEEKQAAIGELEARLRQGEDFALLVLEASEDELTKTKSGDLGFFSESRVPAEFVAEIKRLRAGETTRAFRTSLGFHIVRLDEIREAHRLTYEQVRGEIALLIANKRRVERFAQVRATLSRPANSSWD